MQKRVKILGGGLAGSECALQLAQRGFSVCLVEMRPVQSTSVHKTADFAELVCSNSLKSTNPASAAGMLKQELSLLGSYVYQAALDYAVAAGGALAVNRSAFSQSITRQILDNPAIEVQRREARSLKDEANGFDALVLATGPLTSDALARDVQSYTKADYLSFYDAAAPIVLSDSLDMSVLFRQSRYEEGLGDYLNAPFTKEEYEAFTSELLSAEKVILKDFETKDLFQACQPIEEIARSGFDAPRFGAMKPVGLIDPRTGKRPWAVVQLRAEDAYAQSYNLVGFQTNLTFPEQKRVFRMIPGLENAEFARYGVMHRNTFIDAPRMLDASLQLMCVHDSLPLPVFVAGQLGGTEGYAEAIRSGLHVALSVAMCLQGIEYVPVPVHTVFGALLAYATSSDTIDYQPSHVNFGILEPLEVHIRNKKQRYEAYAQRGCEALALYAQALQTHGLM